MLSRNKFSQVKFPLNIAKYVVPSHLLIRNCLRGLEWKNTTQPTERELLLKS